MQKIFTKLNEALASAKALLHASRHVAESDSVALQQHRICAALESSVKERGKVYFADFYCSWKKGAIENANKLIWKYIPKKANFADFSDRRIMEIQKKLNRRPREKLTLTRQKIDSSSSFTNYALADGLYEIGCDSEKKIEQAFFFTLTLHYLLIR